MPGRVAERMAIRGSSHPANDQHRRSSRTGNLRVYSGVLLDPGGDDPVNWYTRQDSNL